MPVALLPEEVVEVFVGDTLEDAMAAAVAALGPDLSVRRARKVRRGMQGLVGRDRYEVVAAPAPVVSDDAVGSAFDALLTLAEERETPALGRQAPVVSFADELAPRTGRPAAVPEPRGRRTTRPHPAPEVAEHLAPSFVEPVAAPVPSPVTDEPAAVVPVSAKRPPARRAAARKPTPSGWSTSTLRALGLPALVLDALPADEPTDDLAWVVALAAAITSVLPAPAALDDDHPVVVNGHGRAGALGLLDAAARGLTPGTITLGDRTTPATATELALVVRAAVLG